MKRALLMYAGDYFQGGLWRYAYNLGKNLVRLDTNNTYNFFHGQKKDENFISLSAYEKIEPQSRWGKVFVQPQKLANQQFDLVHQTENFCPFFLKKQPYKKIITIHDITPLKFPQYFSKSNWWYYKFILPLLLRRVDRIICPSIATKKDLVRFYRMSENKIRVIYEGVEEAFFQPIPDQFVKSVLERLNIVKPYVLALGVNFHRNLSTVFRAFKNLPSSIRENINLVVAGATGREYVQKRNFIGRGTEYLGKEVTEFGLTSQVIFTGHISDDELRVLYQRAQVFCFASLSEGFGFPPLEAMASNCLVIASNVTAMPETLGPNALLLDPMDDKAWANCLVEVLKNPEHFRSYKERGQQRARYFSWQQCAREHLDLYNS